MGMILFWLNVACIALNSFMLVGHAISGEPFFWLPFVTLLALAINTFAAWALWETRHYV